MSPPSRRAGRASRRRRAKVRIVGIAGEPRRGRRARRAKSRPRPTAPRCRRSRWPISSSSRRASSVTLRALLEELRAAGLELVAEAPFDRLQNPRRSIEEVNIAGLALARLTVHQLAVGRSAAAARSRSPSCSARVGVDPRVRAAAAPRQSGRADHRLRRREARRAGAAGRRQHRRRFRWTGRSTARSWRRWR